MSNRINTALLSYGMSGEVFHAPLINTLPQFNLTHMVQRKGNRAKEHFPAVTICQSVDEVFLNDDIELVVVNTPNETHFDFASRAIKAGKHVVVEKPLTVNTAEADALIELAKKNNRILTVFQNRRWDGDFLTVKKIISQKLVGKIVECEAHYDRFRNYIEADTWKEEARPGTGIVYNLGSHMLDQVVDLFGLPLYVDARIGIQRPEGEVDDYFDIRMQYEGMNVIVKSSYLVKEQGPRYVIHGVQGSFVKYGLDVQEQDLKDKKIPGGEGWGIEPEANWGKLNILVDDQEHVEKYKSEKGDYLAFYKNVAEVIREGKPLMVQPEQVREVIRLIEVCYESNAKKQAIKFV